MKRIGAGIVTYNPDIKRLKSNIYALCSEMELILLVDNNSKNINQIEDVIKNCSKVELIKNSDNFGVGAALNTIMHTLIDSGFEWALLLDQDSIIAPNLISQYRNHMDDSIGLISPYILDLNKMTVEEFNSISRKLPEYSFVDFAITSGSCLNIEIFKLVGDFDADLFIDGIDTDYSRRLSINRYKQIRINKTYIMHEVGKAEATRFYRIHRDNAGKLSLMKYYRTNHSPIRLYYMARNNIILTRRYSLYYSSIRGYLFVTNYMLGKLLFEKNKKEVFSAIYKGIKDGMNYKVKQYRI